jgi:VIT1/CCC1 family predicted Fe2+/Mn2+ transporter
MPDKSIIGKLIESTPLAVILVGVVVFIVAAGGGLPIGNPPIQIIDPAWKIGLGLLGGMLVIVGLEISP